MYIHTLILASLLALRRVIKATPFSRKGVMALCQQKTCSRRFSVWKRIWTASNVPKRSSHRALSLRWRHVVRHRSYVSGMALVHWSPRCPPLRLCLWFPLLHG